MWRTNTISHTTSTPSAISPAAIKPQSCETFRIAWTKRSKLLDAQRLVDQLLAVGYVLRELLVGALLRDLEPLVVLGRCQRHHLDLVVLEHLDHLFVEARRFLGEVGLRLLPRLYQHLLLLLVQAVEGLLRHKHRLVHEPQRVVARRGDALHL